MKDTLEYRTFWSSHFQWFGFGMVGHSNSYSYGLDLKNWTIGNPKKMATILFKTECHWETEQRVTIEIENAFGIPAPTVQINFLRSGTLLVFQSSRITFHLSRKTNPSRSWRSPCSFGLTIFQRTAAIAGSTTPTYKVAPNLTPKKLTWWWLCPCSCLKEVI